MSDEMPLYPLVAFFCFAGALTWGLCFPLRRELLRRQLIDRPNARSSHAVPTPRGGGIAIIATISLSYGYVAAVKDQALPVVLLCCVLLLAAVSLMDDMRPLSARLRFAVHALAGMGIIAAAAISLHVPLSLRFALPLLIALCWIVGYTNAFNFMDGINGIASMQAAVTGYGTVLIVMGGGQPTHSTVPVLASILAGAALGFLPHNFPRARMFMGDVGSAPLGFLLASLALVAVFEVGRAVVIPLLLLHANYVLDTSITLTRRFLRGEKVYQAHKEHFYQRLVRAGKTHGYTTGWECGLQVMTLFLACVYQRIDGLLPQIGLVVAVLGLWVGFFAYAEHLFRQSQHVAGGDGSGAVSPGQGLLGRTCNTCN